jgi:Tol biopolymer transport system component
MAQTQPAQLAYVSNGFHSIHVVRTDGTGDQELVSSPNLTLAFPAWSPDGKVLAYAAANLATIRRDSQQILVFDPATRRTMEVRSSLGTYGPLAFFPDGKHLAAPVGSGPSAVCDPRDIASIDISSGAATPVVTANGCPVSLQVAPDGARLIGAVGTENQENFTVQQFTVGSGESTALTDPDDDRYETWAAVTPDDRTLLYVARSATDPTELRSAHAG